MLATLLGGSDWNDSTIEQDLRQLLKAEPPPQKKSSGNNHDHNKELVKDTWAVYKEFMEAMRTEEELRVRERS